MLVMVVDSDGSDLVRVLDVVELPAAQRHPEIVAFLLGLALGVTWRFLVP